MKQLLLFAASSLVLAGIAQADPDTDLRQQTVIVTAPGPDRDVGELIGNATAIGREGIVETLGTTLGDTLDRQPGVASSFFGQGASRPILRGLGAERVQVLTNGIGVIDVSAASPDHQAAADGIDAEKIEVLRGPAALAYGGQAIGGVVNVIDGLLAEELPKQKFSADVLGAYNSVSDGTEMSGRVQGVQGPFVFTLTGSKRDMGDYDIPGYSKSAALRAETGEDGPKGTVPDSFTKTDSLAGGASWVGEKAFLGVAVRQQKANYGLPGEADASPFIDLKQTRYDARGGIKFDKGYLTQVTGTVSTADYAHTEFEGPGEPGTRYETSGTEARLEAANEIGLVKGAVGLQYTDKDLDAFGDEAFITLTKSDSLGGFVYETIDWDNGFGLEGGGRVEKVNRSNMLGDTDFDLFSASLGAHHHWDNGWFVGLQAAHTERAPNESELYADGLHLATEQYEVGDINLDKEKGLNVEATARWESSHASFGVNLFRTMFDGFVFLAPGVVDHGTGPVSEIDGLPVYQFLQQDATFTGAEIYGKAFIPEGLLKADWTLDGGIDMVRAELDAGGNVPLIPPLTVNTGAKADWRLWSAAAHVTWADKQTDTGAGELPTDGYTQLDLRADVKLSELGFGRDGTTLFVDARNVTDEEIRYSTSVLKDKLPAPGRNIRVGVRASF
ncbi:MAG: TonB-dependent receptor [Hyphomonas sp.]|nr:TonB-dependent receptor [Hyphomonas sp.]